MRSSQRSHFRRVALWALLSATACNSTPVPASTAEADAAPPTPPTPTAAAAEKPADAGEQTAQASAVGAEQKPAQAANSGDIPAPEDVAAPPEGAERESNGLASKVLSPGVGAKKPKPWDQVKVHYTGWTTDGKMFDSSVKRGQPATFGLEQVIAGWTEGLQLMVEGEKRRLWIPQELAYRGQPGRPAGMLVFDVELLNIIPGKEPIAAPKDVNAPPSKAKKTKSGLAYMVLRPGAAKGHPGKYDRVTVHYTGWTTDGKMFDSSVQRGQPATFGVSQVIEGWTEGLQLMSPGAMYRFWIPEDLAYKGRVGPPQGMLVFDVDLLSFEKMPEPPPVPADVAAAPKDAKTLASGLAYKILKHGAGKVHPEATNRVQVHYTGWTTDGKMFDSSVTSGRPATFGLNQVIPGWTEGVQQLVEGDTARLWIPEALAYKGRPGAPAGTLVFDVQLLKIEQSQQHEQ